MLPNNIKRYIFLCIFISVFLLLDIVAANYIFNQQDWTQEIEIDVLENSMRKWKPKYESMTSPATAVVDLLFLFDSTFQKRFEKKSHWFLRVVSWLVKEMEAVFVNSTLVRPTLSTHLVNTIIMEDLKPEMAFELVDKKDGRFERFKRNTWDGHAMLKSYITQLSANRIILSSAFDHCIIFTSLDLWKLEDGSQQRNIVGCTYQSSTCTLDRYSLVEYTDNLRNLLRTSLHELGHGLGSFHDGGFTISNRQTSNSCRPRDGFIMGLPISSDLSYNFFTFSNCSQKDMSLFLRSSSAFCLFD